MKLQNILILLLLSVCTQNIRAQNPYIQPIIQSVSGDSIFKTIADLQTMDRVTASNSQVPQNYLRQRLLSYQVDTVFFQYFKADTPPNVVGIRYGISDPDEYWVMGAHYDAVLPGAGADDNGSGTAAVVEMARVTQGYQLEKSLLLVLFSAEEVGLWGSSAFTDSAVNHFSMEGMINLDMIAYSHQHEDSSVSVCWKYFCQDLINHYLSACSLYVPELQVHQDTTSGIMYASDHAPFWSKMIPALFLIENSDRWGGTFNPYYHQYSDTIGTSANSRWLAEKTTRSAVATLMLITQPLSTISIPKQTALEEALSIFPNPATSQITIGSSGPFTPENRLCIYDYTGKLVKESALTSHHNTLDVSDLSPGIYFLRTGNSTRGKTKKLIKI